MASIFEGIKQLLADPEQVTFYTSYGYRDDNEWIIPLRVWVHEPRKSAQEALSRIAASIGKLTSGEEDLLSERISALLADSESREQVSLSFDADPQQQIWPLCDTEGKRLKTDLNGVAEGAIRLTLKRANELLVAQGSKQGWLSFRAVSRDHHGTGHIRLIPPEGLSLISDIDDTIKVTDIPAGARVVLRNTFLRQFAAAPGMRERYRRVDHTHAFHYVSGAPWQLYRPLYTFLQDEGFPLGSMHMKSVPAHLLSPATWQDLYKLLGDATVEQKLAQISTILNHFPLRRFTLVGDSGEHDPEIYDELRARHPDQVEAVWIRDVIDTDANPSERLQNMAIIDPTQQLQ